MLPPDFVEKAVGRLGWLALFYAIAHPIFRLVEFPGRLRGDAGRELLPGILTARRGNALHQGALCER